MDNGFVPAPHPLAPGWLDFLIVFGAVVLVAGLLFFLVLVFHKPRPRHRRRVHRSSRREQLQKTAGGLRDMIRQRRHRRHHHEHRPLNPTLAQTGGLPPLRDETKPPPPPP